MTTTILLERNNNNAAAPKPPSKNDPIGYRFIVIAFDRFMHPGMILYLFVYPLGYLKQSNS